MVEKKSVKIAAEGCCHGELDSIYKSLPPSVELLIICGDFQALRNKADLSTINVPQKFKRLGGFHEYYKGTKTAPVLTIFIGGNHECSSYLQELQFGGWVAPNIYYLGEAGVVWFKGLRIGGWSGIYNHSNFINNTAVEKLPYDRSSLRSVYHTKPKNFLKLFSMGHDLDIMLSHDWPVGIENHGDVQYLLRKKPFFREDIKKGHLGSPLNSTLLHNLKPRYWFSAHLHVYFEALVNHASHDSTPRDKHDERATPISLEKNDDQISLSMDDSDEDPACSESEQSPDNTKFLALDKCGPHRKFMKVVDIPVVHDHVSLDHEGLFYDERCITTHHVIERLIRDKPEVYRRIDARQFMRIEDLPIAQELSREIDVETASLQKRALELQIPSNFEPIAPTTDHSSPNIPLKYWENNQTREYCNRFDISYTPPWVNADVRSVDNVKTQ